MHLKRTLVVALIQIVLLTLPAPAQDKPAKPEKKETTASLAKTAKKLAHELRMAELKLKVAKLDTRIADDGAHAAARKSKRELEVAKATLAHFDKFIAPSRVAEAKIGLDAAKNRADQAKDEFNELVAMYKQEDFAEMTKELVLKRGRHNMELAKRRLKIQEDKFMDLQKTILPREREVLRGKLEDAEAAANQASLKLKKAALQSVVTIQEAEHKLATSHTELDEVRTKLAKRVKK